VQFRVIHNLKSQIQNRAGHQRGRLVRHYFFISVVLISSGLITSGLVEIYFRYYESREQLDLYQQEVTAGAAFKIEQFIREIERTMKGATRSREVATTGLSPEYRFELEKLLLLAPAIIEAVALGEDGTARVRASRPSAFLSEGEQHLSSSAPFQQAKQGQSYFGPVYFGLGSQQTYMTLAVPIERSGGDIIGVLQAEVDLDYVADVVSGIKLGRAGYAYLVTRSGDLVAHRDTSLVLHWRDVRHLNQVKAAFQRSPGVSKHKAEVTKNLQGTRVVSSHALIPRLDWAVLIERPLGEAYEPLYASVLRTSALLLVGLGVALLASVFVSRRVVRPLQTLRQGVERIGRGDLGFRLEVKTADEIGALAEEFNKMTSQLQESYASLEQKVEERTAALQMRSQELSRTVEELKALGEVSQAVSSTLDLDTVLSGIVSHSVQLSGTDGGIIYEYDEGIEEFVLRTSHRLEEGLIEALRARPIRLGEGAVGQAAATRMPVEVMDILDEREYAGTRLRPVLARLGYRSILAVPLLREERILGGLVVLRRQTGSFSTEVVNLLQTLATQSVIAIHNARLYREIQEKGRQLELASKYKSQFLANMSHELRTPLNAVLGYTRMLLMNIYGQLPQTVQDVLGRVDKSGRHLLGLINDVLDLSKIEAGQLTLSLNSYSMKEVVQNVLTAMQPLAAEKKLALRISLPSEMPAAQGDERRIVQVLLNLVGNAIKFTDVGEVRVQVTASDGALVVAVSDTGPGIPEEDRQRVFEEFRQVENSATAKKGGTGLGLAIAKRIIELHGGRIWVESSMENGSTFCFTLPVRVGQQTRAI
jgi:signal transduction histidine kinase